MDSVFKGKPFLCFINRALTINLPVIGVLYTIQKAHAHVLPVVYYFRVAISRENHGKVLMGKSVEGKWSVEPREIFGAENVSFRVGGL